MNFKKRRLKVEGFEGFPGYAHRLLIPQLVGQLPDLTSWVPHELVALEYSADRGSNIDLHRDDTWVWGPRIVGVNMQAGAWMLFVSDLDPSTAVEVWLPPRSAYLLQGPARHHWRHGVRMGRVAAGAPRVSVTFRELTEDVLSSPEGEQVALRAGRIVC